MANDFSTMASRHLEASPLCLLAPWQLRDGERDIDWILPASVTVSTDAMGVIWLAEQGMRIALRPRCR